jgi:mono/diheme cytochrome c family protein
MNRLSLCLIALTAPVFAPPAAAQAVADERPYRVLDGKVDESTFLGWRAFHSVCHACHGVDAVGTAVAPNLVERVKQLSARDFTVKVLTSYRLVVPAGEMKGDDPTTLRSEFVAEVLRRERGELIMPAWEGHEKTRAHLLDLYAYLRARADGALGPGAPERIDD